MTRWAALLWTVACLLALAWTSDPCELPDGSIDNRCAAKVHPR